MLRSFQTIARSAFLPALALFLTHCSILARRAPLRIEDFAIQANYTDEEKAVPFLFAPLPESPPDSFVLPSLIPAGNQLRQASGVAWATGYLASSYYFRTRRGMRDYTCSPAFLYNSLNGGRDQGIAIVETLDLIQRQGCSELSYMPYNEKDFYRRPSEEALHSAEKFKVSGYTRVDYKDPAQIRAHLLQGSVIVVTLKITENFADLRDETWVPAGKFIALHTVGIVGYDIKRQEVLIQNSAGVEWGREGRAAIPWSWFERLTEKAFVLF